MAQREGEKEGRPEKRANAPSIAKQGVASKELLLIGNVRRVPVGRNAINVGRIKHRPESIGIN